jgi:hypothetical protein
MDAATLFRQKAKEQGLLLSGHEKTDTQRAILKLASGPIMTHNDPHTLNNLFHLAEAFSAIEADEMRELTATLHQLSAANDVVWMHENPLNPSASPLIHLAS